MTTTLLPVIPDKPWSKSSAMSLLDGCQHQWFLEKVRKLETPDTPQTVVGTVFHAGIERHERIRILRERDGSRIPLPSLDEVISVCLAELAEAQPHIPENQYAIHSMEPGDLAVHLEQACRHWWSTPIPDGQPGAGGSLRDRIMRMRPVAVEPYFSVPLPGTRRGGHGYIDWLGYDHDTASWCVVDNKTANTFGRWGHDASGHELEATMYVVGAEVARSLPATDGNVRMEWHIVRKEPGRNSRFEGARVVQVEVGAAERQYVASRLTLADEIVDGQQFLPNTGWNLCSPRWCGFHGTPDCPATMA